MKQRWSETWAVEDSRWWRNPGQSSSARDGKRSGLATVDGGGNITHLLQGGGDIGFGNMRGDKRAQSPRGGQ